MTETIPAQTEEDAGVTQDPCICESYARATERAGLAAARWLGRADQQAAEEAATSGMALALSELPIQGRIVIGTDEGDLRHGVEVGLGGPHVDLALDPLEGRGIVARGGNGAMSMIAVGDAGSLLTLPDMYMRKMAVGPRARGKIDINRPMAENIKAIADAFGRQVNDVTTIILDRPRHHDLIEEIRAAGARIKLIQDGDVTAAISAAIRGTNDHLAIGIGGTRQALMTAAALRCLGGEMQAQLWPTSRREIEQAAEQGIEDNPPHLHDRRPRARRDDRRRHGRLERRPPARRAVPHRQRAHPFARHVHALQLGPVRRRHPLLPPRTARGSPPLRALGSLWA